MYMNLPVSDMLLCALMWWVATWVSPCIRVCTGMCSSWNGLSTWGHAFSKGAVCDTYENSGNSGENSGIVVISGN